MEEALLDEEDVPLDKKEDWEDVQNYVAAMNEAVAKLQTLPFSVRLIRDTHKTLLQGVRGTHKQPGEFRYTQNSAIKRAGQLAAPGELPRREWVL